MCDMELFIDCLKAFAVGGAFCVAAQLLIDLTSLTPAKILVTCGVSVPLVGFGGAVALGVRSAVETDGLLGALTGGMTAAAAGTTAALCFGYATALIFKAKRRRA